MNRVEARGDGAGEDDALHFAFAAGGFERAEGTVDGRVEHLGAGVSELVLEGRGDVEDGVTALDCFIEGRRQRDVRDDEDFDERAVALLQRASRAVSAHGSVDHDSVLDEAVHDGGGVEGIGAGHQDGLVFLLGGGGHLGQSLVQYG